MSEGINVAARAFAWWAAGHEGVEARQLLAGLGHLGDFLRAVSTAEIDLELGYNGLDTAEIELQAAEVESEMPNSQTEYSRPASSPSSISERSSRSDADVRIPHSEWPSEDERASNIFKRRFSGPEYAFLERHFLRGTLLSPLLTWQALHRFQVSFVKQRQKRKTTKTPGTAITHNGC